MLLIVRLSLVINNQKLHLLNYYYASTERLYTLKPETATFLDVFYESFKLVYLNIGSYDLLADRLTIQAFFR